VYAAAYTIRPESALTKIAHWIRDGKGMAMTDSTKAQNAREILVIALAALALVACVLLAGCGVKGTPNNEANFIGDWAVVEIEEDGMKFTADDLALFGMELTLTLNEDGTGSMSMFGESQPFTWQANSATEISLAFDDSTNATFTLNGNVLSGEEDGASISFKRAS